MNALILLASFLTIADPNEAAPDLDKVDAVKLDKAKIVLRVRKVAPRIQEGGKHHWDTVEILYAYKNTSKMRTLGKTLNVAHYGWRVGVPDGVSTIYLEPFNPDRNDLWKLLGGDGVKGTSHATTK